MFCSNYGTKVQGIRKLEELQLNLRIPRSVDFWDANIFLPCLINSLSNSSYSTIKPSLHQSVSQKRSHPKPNKTIPKNTLATFAKNQSNRSLGAIISASAEPKFQKNTLPSVVPPSKQPPKPRNGTVKSRHTRRTHQRTPVRGEGGF